LDLGNLVYAFGLTLIAGLSTGIGAALAFFTSRTNTRFLSVALGFSAGVMIYVSMIEIFFKAKDALVFELGEKLGSWATAGAFFAGMFIFALIDTVIPVPHEPKMVEDIDGTEEAAAAEQIAAGSATKPEAQEKLMRMGLFSALAIAVHNFPEGMATFTAAIKDPSLGLPIAVAIAIHNIPEGIAVSVPIFYATGNKLRGFWYSLISGLSEPLGALVGFLLLTRFFSDAVFGILFAAVAGIMVFISLDELLPAAREYGEHHLAIYGLVAGMIVMAVSLLLFV